MFFVLRSFAFSLGLVFLVGLTSPTQAQEQLTIQNSTGRDMAVEKFGSGTIAVILAHQYDASRLQWAFFARELAQRGYTAYTFDFNGHGKNTKGGKQRLKNDLDLGEMVKLARAEGAKKVYMIGSSMGAAAVLKAGISQKLDGIIAMAPYLDNSRFAALSTSETGRVSEDVLLFTTKNDSSYSNAVDLDMLLPNATLYAYAGNAHGMGLLRTNKGTEVRNLIFGFLK
ncbi:MAG: alpha/beta hydrolase [Alphaproteobacteria bacterium]|nr:alpha/beta hydrolase [Alphaproteobacteria bacterium]